MSKLPPKQQRRGGCSLRLSVLALLGVAALGGGAEHYFNLRGNISYYAFRTSTAPLEVKLAHEGWKAVSAVSIAELNHARELKSDFKGARWSRLSVRREAHGLLQEVAQSVVEAEVNVLEFAPSGLRFETSFRDHFALTTARERLEAGGYDFAIVANFRDPRGKPLGLVVHDGREVNRHFPAWTGYFFVKEGKPWFGPKSLFDETPGMLTEATQGYPSVMKNHTVFNYVDLAPNKYFDGNKITYRALAGMRRDGTIVFILSGNGGGMNVAEVTALALKLEVQHATLLDGGRALQYSLRLADGEYHFEAFNTRLDLPWKVVAAQRSPVFIGVRAVR